MSQIFHRSDTENPCAECSQERFERWQFDCHRGDLESRILDLALGTGEWFLYNKHEDRDYRVLIEYDAISAKTIFRDFREVPGRVTALSQPAIPLLDFLENIESHWPRQFEPYSVELIQRCALFQKALLARQTVALEDLPDEHIPIALALRCLVLTEEIAEVEGTIPACVRDEDQKRTYFKKYHDEDPLIDVIRMSSRERSSAAGSQIDSEDRIPSLLENLVQTIQRLIMRQDPRQWPLILCTLFIFEEASSNHSTSSDPMSGDPMSVLRSSSEALSSTHSALCHWFHVCSQMHQPLTDNWDKEDFSKLVDDDPLLMEMFQWLNDGWLEGIPPFCSSTGSLTDIMFITNEQQNPVSMQMVFQRVCLWRKESRLSRQVMHSGEINVNTVTNLHTSDGL